MVHQPADGNSDGAEAGVDSYDDSQSDPADSHAVESSLWELDILRKHHNAMVCMPMASLKSRHCCRRVTDQSPDVQN
jgi:hypothetical protein